MTLEDDLCTLKGWLEGDRKKRRQPIHLRIPFEAIANVSVRHGILSMALLQRGEVQAVVHLIPRKRKDLAQMLSLLPTTLTAREAQIRSEFGGFEAALRANVKRPWCSWILGVSYAIVYGIAVGSGDYTRAVYEIGCTASHAFFVQPWRFLTYGFAHGGLIHLAVNSLSLVLIGPLAERLFGRWLFLGVYLVSLVAGGMLSVGFQPSVMTLGASGALFGLLAAILAYLVRCRESVPPMVRRDLLRNGVFILVANLLYGIRPGVDNVCHIGGMVGGFVSGWLVAMPLGVRHRFTQVFARLTGLLVGASAFFLVLWADQYNRRPLFWLIPQTEAIEEAFKANHPEYVNEEGALAPPKELWKAYREVAIEELYTPQIDFLDGLPPDSLNGWELAIQKNLRNVAHGYRLAILKEKAEEEGQASEMYPPFEFLLQVIEANRNELELVAKPLIEKHRLPWLRNLE